MARLLMITLGISLTIGPIFELNMDKIAIWQQRLAPQPQPWRHGATMRAKERLDRGLWCHGTGYGAAAPLIAGLHHWIGRCGTVAPTPGATAPRDADLRCKAAKDGATAPILGAVALEEPAEENWKVCTAK